MSETSSGRMAFIAEVTPGITPATPAFKALDFTSESLTKTKTPFRSAAVNANRVVKNSRALGQQTSGDINFELVRGTEIDELIAAVLGNPFAGSPSISKLGGLLQPTFTFERRISATSYRRFVGSKINTLTLGIQPEQAATATLGIIGASSVTAGAIIAGGTYAEPSTAEKLTSIDTTTLAITGGVTGLFDFESITMTIDNNMAPSKRLGPNSTRKIRAGQAFVTGTKRIFLDDNAMSEAWDAGTNYDFEVQLLNAGAGYGLKLGNVSITSYSDANSGNGNEFIADVGFEGVLDVTDATSLIFTKYGA